MNEPSVGSAPAALTGTGTRGFHAMAKPTGSVCNLDCAYCYFLATASLYPGDRSRMSDEVLDAYLRQLIEARVGPEVNVAWQGGEPTLMGIEFFERAVRRGRELAPAGVTVTHALQTNGTLLDDRWARFLATEQFLVGISIDGPADLHDHHRVDPKGRGTSERVLRGLDHLRRHGVDVNVLCTVNAHNAPHPERVYRYLRDELGFTHIQFIPIVESLDDGCVSDRTVSGDAWGTFLCAVFDDWLRRDVGRVFVQRFDVALGAWLGHRSSLCIFAETCGAAVVVEHNGDVYACDHFVDSDHLLGNLLDDPLASLVDLPEQQRFGTDKRDALPLQCRQCPVRFACHGECPRNRISTSANGDPGLNHLCAGYLAFFTHIDGPMRLMADLLRAGRPAAEVMSILRSAGRNDPCPCGSGSKAKHCHQR